MPLRTWKAPNSKLDDDKPSPRGQRTENGFPWANTPSAFFQVKSPKSKEPETKRVWSRSMIEELGGTPLGDRVPPEPAPHVLQPWPILKFQEAATEKNAKGNKTTVPKEIITRAKSRASKISQTCTAESSPVSGFDDIDLEDEAMYDPTGVPKLEEYIPKEFLPDILVFHVGGSTYEYVRKYPRRGSPTTKKEGHLYDLKDLIGNGNHSSVHRVSLLLPPPLSVPSSPNKCVTVAVKRCKPLSRDKDMLFNEGEIYARFPRHLQESSTGYNMVPGIAHPVPIGPVVPNFYGFYVSKETKEMSPLLLIEDCGEVALSFGLDEKQKIEGYSLVKRLHHAGFVQNSMHYGNVVAQPGPLTAPPAQRTNRCPSFRIIDFGRSISFKGCVKPHPRSVGQCPAIKRPDCRAEAKDAKDVLRMYRMSPEWIQEDPLCD